MITEQPQPMYRLSNRDKPRHIYDIPGELYSGLELTEIDPGGVERHICFLNKKIVILCMAIIGKHVAEKYLQYNKQHYLAMIAKSVVMIKDDDYRFAELLYGDEEVLFSKYKDSIEEPIRNNTVAERINRDIIDAIIFIPFAMRSCEKEASTSVILYNVSAAIITMDLQKINIKLSGCSSELLRQEMTEIGTKIIEFLKSDEVLFLL